MYRIILVVLAAILAPKAPAYAQYPIYESLHSPDETWIVTDENGNSVDLVGDMHPGQILLVLPVDRNGEDFLSELTPFEEVLEVLGESGTQELSIALVEVSGHDLTSDSWASSTSIPIYSSQSATLTTPAYDGDSQILYSSIQKLSDGTFIEAWRTFYGLSTFAWWEEPLLNILYQSEQYFNFEAYYFLEGAAESFLTLNAGFPTLDESWCAAVGCQLDNFESYQLGAGASESNPESWQPYGGLVGTSQDGTIVTDPLNPENRVLELKTDSINGDVGFANKHLHTFGEYEIEFDLLRRENKGAFFIGFNGEFGDPTTLLGNDLGYTGYFGRLYVTEQGEASTYWFERRGVDLNLSAESWHHVKVGSANRGGFYIEIDGNIVWAVDNYYSGSKFSAMNFWTRSDIDCEFLIDNVLIKPIYRRTVSDFEGCSNPNACNYNLVASNSTSLCEFPEPGKNCAGDCIQDSNNDGYCDGVVGCTDPGHPLYDPSATVAEECCTVFEHANSFYADLQRSSRILRQSAWSLSRIVVTDSLENEVYFDSGQEWNALEDFQADDKYLFQQEGENNLISTSSFGFLEYDNQYISQNHLLNYGPELGVYGTTSWNIDLGFSCAPNFDSLTGESEVLMLQPIRLFSAGFELLPPGSAEERPSFLGATDAQGYECSDYYFGRRGFVIKTLNDSVLVVKSPLADSGNWGVHGLITFEAEPHDFPFCVLGCTEPTACNYESHATFDDGTCTFFCESGCTDEDALNYDPSAVIDDGSCNYFCGFASIGDLESAWSNFIEPGLLFSDATHLELGANSVAENSIVVPQNFQNSAGGAFPIASFTPTSISGLPPGMQTSLFPLNGELSPYSYGCIRLEGIPETVGVYNVAVEGDLSVFFGTLEQDFGSFTYNWVIVVNEGQDPILGCTYPDASNFVSYANDDDGSCVFDASPELCPADFDGNGQVGTPDLLDFLSYFGAICD